MKISLILNCGWFGRSHAAKSLLARTAIQSALLDAIGKLLDKPVYRLLGQRVKPLPTSVTVGIKAIPDTLEEIQDYMRNGFRIIKVKIGKTVEEDVERLHKICEEYGNKVQLRVDINQGYSLSEFRWFLKKTNDISFDVIEQPLPTSEFEYMELLHDRTIANIAADENRHSPGGCAEVGNSQKKIWDLQY
ncbi:MAG: enolase C-terminal domain-like protein [Spirochaetia bacterium]|nr:enolase C-terminal domain-like protein [Spirochaetia bacterium]